MVLNFNDEMSIEDYLKNGGVLSSPAHVPARYRAELLRLMTSFIDSELAASAGFSGVLNEAPGINQRISAARIILEKAENGAAVLEVMGEFGADIERYANGVHTNSNFNWADRLERNADIGSSRAHGGDMRLSVFYYPLLNWQDAVMMNVLMGKASEIQLEEMTKISYAPLAEIFRSIRDIELVHTSMGRTELLHLAKGAFKNGTSEELKASFHYWLPRVRATFGSTDSSRFERLKNYGLRHTSNSQMLDNFNKRAEELWQALQLITTL